MRELSGLTGSSPSCESVPRQITLSERLNMQKMELEDRLAKVNAAIEILAENPKMQELLDIVGRVA